MRDRELWFSTRSEMESSNLKNERTAQWEINKNGGMKWLQEVKKQRTRKSDMDTQSWPRKAKPEAEGKNSGWGQGLRDSSQSCVFAILEEEIPPHWGSSPRITVNYVINEWFTCIANPRPSQHFYSSNLATSLIKSSNTFHLVGIWPGYNDPWRTQCHWSHLVGQNSGDDKKKGGRISGRKWRGQGKLEAWSGMWGWRVSPFLFSELTALGFADLQELYGYHIGQYVDPVANICGPVLEEAVLREVQPFLGEDHDQQQKEGNQAELWGQHLYLPVGAVCDSPLQGQQKVPAVHPGQQPFSVVGRDGVPQPRLRFTANPLSFPTLPFLSRLLMLITFSWSRELTPNIPCSHLNHLLSPLLSSTPSFPPWLGSVVPHLQNIFIRQSNCHHRAGDLGKNNSVGMTGPLTAMKYSWGAANERGGPHLRLQLPSQNPAPQVLTQNCASVTSLHLRAWSLRVSSSLSISSSLTPSLKAH